MARSPCDGNKNCLLKKDYDSLKNQVAQVLKMHILYIARFIIIKNDCVIIITDRVTYFDS